MTPRLPTHGADRRGRSPQRRGRADGPEHRDQGDVQHDVDQQADHVEAQQEHLLVGREQRLRGHRVDEFFSQSMRNRGFPNAFKAGTSIRPSQFAGRYPFSRKTKAESAANLPKVIRCRPLLETVSDSWHGVR